MTTKPEEVRELIEHMQRFAAKVPSVAKLWRVDEAATTLDQLLRENERLLLRVAELEHEHERDCQLWNSLTISLPTLNQKDTSHE